MNAKTILSLALAFASCGGLDVASAMPPSPFVVDVRTSRTDVRVNVPFKVTLRVINISHSNQTVRVMNCSWYDEWQTSNTNLIPKLWPCTRNFPVDVSLRPGGFYTNELEMSVRESFPSGKLWFRMGFTPIGSTTTFWSEDGYITVFPQGSPAELPQTDEKFTDEVSRALKDCEKIKVGMTRAQLLEMFTREGGIFTATQRRYAYRRCPYIKVDVEFELSAPDQGGLDERMTDTISKISQPFLEWGIMD